MPLTCMLDYLMNKCTQKNSFDKMEQEKGKKNTKIGLSKNKTNFFLPLKDLSHLREYLWLIEFQLMINSSAVVFVGVLLPLLVEMGRWLKMDEIIFEVKFKMTTHQYSLLSVTISLSEGEGQEEICSRQWLLIEWGKG